MLDSRTKEIGNQARFRRSSNILRLIELGLADALHHARARGLHSLSLGRWMIARLAVQIPMWPQPLLATRNLSASRLYSSGVAR